MADTSVAITAGTGTAIDTRTEATNGNHRQVVVIGDPSVNAGVAPVDATNGLSVNITNASLTVASHAVTNAGTFAVQAAQSGTWTVQPGNTANTTPWLTKLHDGTNAVAVKAASTAPTATDPALVVAISPNSVNANGQNTMANSAPVVLSSNHSDVPTKEKRSATGTPANVASSATSVTILASNANRLGATVFNDSTQVLYLLLSTGTASATNYSVQIASNGYYEIPFNFTGQLTGIWASANGNARVTELT